MKLFGLNATCHVWRGKNAGLHPKNIILTAKYVGGNIMLWDSFSWKGTGWLIHIKEMLSGTNRCETLGKNLPWVKSVKLKQGLTFQCDNDPRNTIVQRSRCIKNISRLWSGITSLQTSIHRRSSEGVESPCCPATAPKQYSSRKDLHGRMGKNICYTAWQLSEDLQETFVM